MGGYYSSILHLNMKIASIRPFTGLSEYDYCIETFHLSMHFRLRVKALHIVSSKKYNN